MFHSVFEGVALFTNIVSSCCYKLDLYLFPIHVVSRLPSFRFGNRGVTCANMRKQPCSCHHALIQVFVNPDWYLDAWYHKLSLVHFTPVTKIKDTYTNLGQILRQKVLC